MSLISGSDDAGDLKAVFALFDTDHDEKLSAADAGHAWRLLGFEITAADTMGFVTIELDDWFAATQALSARQCDSVLAGRDPSEAVATLGEMPRASPVEMTSDWVVHAGDEEVEWENGEFMGYLEIADVEWVECELEAYGSVKQRLKQR